MGQKYAAYNDQGTIIGYYDSIDSPPPPDATVIAITDQQWLTCLQQPGWTVVDGQLVPPPPPPLTADQLNPVDYTFSLPYGDEPWQSLTR